MSTTAPTPFPLPAPLPRAAPDGAPSPPSGLETLGLDADEAVLYAHLVRAGWAPLTSAGSRAGLPEPRATRALRSLLLRDLAVEGRLGGDDVVFPVAPMHALERSVRDAQEAVDRARSVVRRLEDRYAESRSRLDSGALVTVVTGAGAIRRTLERLQEQAREETVWLCRARPLAITDAENTAELDALARGIRYRVVYDTASLQAPGALEPIRDVVRSGEDARLAPRVPLRLMIADGEVGVCPLVAERRDAEPSAAVISSSMLLHGLSELFEHEWRRALPLDVVAPEDPGARTREAHPFGWDPATVRLVSLLVAGLTDGAIATQLGISPRTVQRRLADAMRSCGATTRLELAYRFGRQGRDV